MIAIKINIDVKSCQLKILSPHLYKRTFYLMYNILKLSLSLSFFRTCSYYAKCGKKREGRPKAIQTHTKFTSPFRLQSISSLAVVVHCRYSYRSRSRCRRQKRQLKRGKGQKKTEREPGRHNYKLHRYTQITRLLCASQPPDDRSAHVSSVVAREARERARNTEQR